MSLRCAHLIAMAVLAAGVGAVLAAEPDSASLRFDISRFDVSGNTLLPQQKIDQVLAPFTGRQRDFGDVQRALETLEAEYHARGYGVVTVELPEQELKSGVVRLKVVQTRVGRVTVKGNAHFDEANIRRSVPGLQEGQTPNLNQVSGSLKLANDNPAKKVGMKLQSGTQDDEVDATLDVADQRAWSATVNADNSGTGPTGRSHAGVVLQNDNLWGLDHVASLQYTTSTEHPSAVKVYGAGYHIPLYALGDSLDFYGSYSNVDSGTVTAGVFDLAVSGKGAVYGARYNQSLAKSGNLDSSLAYGIDYKAYKNNVQLLGQQLGNDVTVHPLSVSYLGSWTWPGAEASAAITGVRNIAGGNNGGQADFSRARSGATANYNILRLAASLSHILPRDWQARIMVNGQYTSDALIPGEQFGAGGATSVRGFAEREIADDIGLAANLELYTPNLCGAHAGWNCRALAFYDSAYIKRNRELAGELSSTAIGSVGIGMRMLITNAVNLQLDYGHVVRAGATDSVDANRVHLRLSLSY
jgi:hemolysin activation/secretion protein